jgi:hypothetical protein
MNNQHKSVSKILVHLTQIKYILLKGDGAFLCC